MITIDASDASRLAKEMGAHTARLGAEIQTLMRATGPVIRDQVRALAPVTDMVPGYSGTIGSRVTSTAAGATITVSSRSPFGFILEFGAGRSGPHPHFGPVFDPATAALETALSALVDRVV